MTRWSGPPKLACWLVALLVRGPEAEFVLGDMLEGFNEVLQRVGPGRARVWFWAEAFRTVAQWLRPSAISARRPGGSAGEPEDLRSGRAAVFTDALADVGYALRGWRRKPGFTTVCILVLALGIGANTGILAVMNAALFAPPPGISDAVGLVGIGIRAPNVSFRNLGYPVYELLREESESFIGIAGSSAIEVDLRGTSGPERIIARAVSPDYFEVLGTAFAYGRGLGGVATSPEDLRTVVLSYGTWETRFGSAPDVIGQSVSLNGHSFTVVGVTERGFKGSRSSGDGPEAWVRVETFPVTAPGSEFLLTSMGDFWLETFARLAPGRSLEAANAEIDALMRPLLEAEGWTPDQVGFVLNPHFSWHPNTRAPLRSILLMMLALAGLILLVACANVANLLLARSASKRQELAVRSALGAGRGRLVRQLLVETVLLATAGGAVGIGVAYAVSRIVLAFAPVSIATPVPIDVRVLGFALTASLIMGLAFGLSPAVQGAKTARATLPGSRGSATGPRQSRARGALVVSQIVMSMVSIVAAGVLVQSLRHFLAQDPGFEVEGLVGTTIDLRTRDLDVETGIAFQREFLDRARALPGVEGASLTQIVPLSGAGRGGGLLAEGRTESFDMSYGVVAPGYFETLGIPVLRGRDFNLDDGPNAEGVVILSDLAAETLWPGEEAVGRRIRRDVDQPWLRVVGVVGTIAYYELGEQPQPYFYRPQFQRYGPVTTLLVRSALDRRTVVSSLRREIGSLDPELAVGRVRSMAELVASRSQSRRSSAVVATLFSGLALLLAAVGVFGTLSELVHQRRQEIGVRMALGARRGDVTRFIVAKGLGLGLLGVALGVPAAAGAVRLLSGFLFGVRSLDPLPFLGAAVVVIAVVLLATYLPARHAGRFDPARVLQSD